MRPALTKVSRFAQEFLDKMPPQLAELARQRWLKTANVKPVCKPHALQYEYSDDKANCELYEFAKPLMHNPLPLDLNASDDDICSYADKQAALFCSRAKYGMDIFKQLKLAEKDGLDDWQNRFAKQIKAGNWEAIALRLQDARWWRRFLRRAIGRRLENTLRGGMNLIHRRHWLYVSAPALVRRRQQKHRNRVLLESLKMVNELGQTFTLAELVEKSNANPAIRRAELMTRIAGFEYIARETGHIGEFITLTCPSRFHAAHHVSGSQNSKYDGSTPTEAQAYLQKVWGRIQASLQRQEIAVYGFRVAEPHHDGTPHWHGLFFMPKEHRQAFRRTVARYACRDSREELGLDYFETKAAAIEQAKLIQAAQRRRAIEHGGHVSSIKSLLADMQTEAGFWAAADYRAFRQVDARVNFKAIDWRRGTAAGYIAKYIAKNIDGKNTLGDSVGIDYEADGRNVVETAELVDAWASLHGIRQFQQIGGAPVTTWRELRREGMTAGDYNDTIVRASLAADAGDWGKFTMIMGGATASRSARPIHLYKEDPKELTRYQEPRPPMIRGVFEPETGLVKISRIHEWQMLQGGKAAPWTGVNNSTKSKKVGEVADFELEDDKVFGGNPYRGMEPPRCHIPLLREEILQQIDRVLESEAPAIIKEREITILHGALHDLTAKPAINSREATAQVAAARAAAEQTRAQSDATREYKHHLHHLDRLSPPANRLPETAIDLTPFKTPHRRWPAPKRHDTAESVMAELDTLLARLETEHDALYIVH